jgi:hypothetical protein
MAVSGMPGRMPEARRKLRLVEQRLLRESLRSGFGLLGPELEKDIHILNARISELKELPQPLINDEAAEEKPVKGKLPPEAKVAGLREGIEGFLGKRVMIEGDLRFSDRNRDGGHWHVFEDSTGFMPALGKTRLEGEGTLFGIARQSSRGKQPFLEIRNFRASDPAENP